MAHTNYSSAIKNKVSKIKVTSKQNQNADKQFSVAQTAQKTPQKTVKTSQMILFKQQLTKYKVDLQK